MTSGCYAQAAEDVESQEIELAFEDRNIANFEEFEGRLGSQRYDYGYGREAK